MHNFHPGKKFHMSALCAYPKHSGDNLMPKLYKEFQVDSHLKIGAGSLSWWSVRLKSQVQY